MEKSRLLNFSQQSQRRLELLQVWWYCLKCLLEWAWHLGYKWEGRGMGKGLWWGKRRGRSGRAGGPPKCAPCWGAATLALPSSSIRLTAQLLPHICNPGILMMLQESSSGRDEITDSRVPPRLCDLRGETSLLDPSFGKAPRPLCQGLVPSCLPNLEPNGNHWTVYWPLSYHRKASLCGLCHYSQVSNR